MSEATRRAGIRAMNPIELDLPTGRRMALGSRGETFYREVPGPPGAPTLVLLHGWVASGGLNWFQTFDVLSRHFRIIAPDMRGHASRNPQLAPLPPRRLR